MCFVSAEIAVLISIILNSFFHTHMFRQLAHDSLVAKLLHTNAIKKNHQIFQSGTVYQHCDFSVFYVLQSSACSVPSALLASKY